MDFATWVQSQIDKFDITVYQISKRSGVHASTIANWLNGAKPQDAKAKAVKIALDEIIKEKQALSSDLLPDGAVIPEESAKKAPTEISEREFVPSYEDWEKQAENWTLDQLDNAIWKLFQIKMEKEGKHGE